MPNLDRRMLVVAALLVLVSFGVGYKYGIYTGSQKAFLEQQVEVLEEKPAETEAEPQKAYIYVAGEVENPGVLEMQQGDRVFQALEKAIPGKKADLTQVNLAAKVSDGEKIVIPRLGQQMPEQVVTVGSGSSYSPSGLVNINTASPEELDQRLPGIGPTLARRIVDYRQAQGGFSSIEGIKEVAGIGEKRFDQIKELICVQ